MIALVCLALLGLLASANAACPHAAAASAAFAADLPTGHPAVPRNNNAPSRKLVQVPSWVTPEYLAQMRNLTTNLETAIGNCQLSLEGMRYIDNQNIIVTSSGVFFPAAMWLRAFFHDAGTHVKKTGKGGPNGSLGAGCVSSANNGACGNTAGVYATTKATCDGTNVAPVGGFTDGKTYCCQNTNECVAHGQAAGTNGTVIPVCLPGTMASNELCRRDNDGLLPTIQFFRGRQNQFKLSDGSKLSLADIIVAGAVAVVKQCSAGKVVPVLTVGRPEVSVADETFLPSPNDLIEQKHAAIFQNMGLNKIDMVTMVTGSHTIGGFRKFTSPGLTNCPYVPFDCTPAGQLQQPPFDNNVFKVACGIPGACAWSTKCTQPSLNQTGTTGCPFDGAARQAFQQCSTTDTYPTPGLSSDINFCQQPETSGRMMKYAEDETFFFQKYQDLFQNMAGLGFKNKDLIAVSSARAMRLMRKYTSSVSP